VPGKLRKSAEWLDWDIEIGYHASKRSQVRGFNETDLRILITDAAGFRPSDVEGRFVLHSRLGADEWRVVVEPDFEEHKLIVVTAWRA
jgi:archaeosine-15-forming tRNA-guanine transglycosylase